MLIPSDPGCSYAATSKDLCVRLVERRGLRTGAEATIAVALAWWPLHSPSHSSLEREDIKADRSPPDTSSNLPADFQRKILLSRTSVLTLLHRSCESCLACKPHFHRAASPRFITANTMDQHQQGDRQLSMSHSEFDMDWGTVADDWGFG